MMWLVSLTNELVDCGLINVLKQQQQTFDMLNFQDIGFRALCII